MELYLYITMHTGKHIISLHAGKHTRLAYVLQNSQFESVLYIYDHNTIIQELIQNADDAGATEVKFLLDHRQHSCNDVVFDDFERFQGPALYAWNNAVFRENDWQSIGKIGQSKKKDDPIKVGRFGLGFLSVFHLTGIIIYYYT